MVKLQYYKGRIEALVKSSPTKGKDIKLVWPEIGLGNDITYQIKVQDGVLSVTVNGSEQTKNIVQNGPAWADQTYYFKAGHTHRTTKARRPEARELRFRN